MNPADERVDLHAHTTASDGTCSPDELVRLARVAGLVAIAVTDHDSVSAVEAAARAGRELDVEVEVVPGVELTAYDDEREIHILGLFIDPGSAAFRGRLSALQLARAERVRRMVAQLGEAGVAITAEEVFEAAGGGAAGRAHVAQVLVKKGVVGEARAAFRRYLQPGRCGYVRKTDLSTADAIGMIREARGIASLAHPGLSNCDEIIPRLVREGLGAIEAAHPRHGRANRDHYRGLARKHEILITGGSDFHGHPGTAVGDATVGRRELQALRAMASARRA